MKRLIIAVACLFGSVMGLNSAVYADEAVSTPMGFILPINWTSISNCGVWQGRPSPNGCYNFGDVYHTGIDLMANEGTKVRAIADGEIVYISQNGWSDGVGDDRNVGVVIEHRMMSSETFRVIYGHVRNLTKGQNATVKSGEVFAEIGDWFDTQDHLHLGVLAAGLEFPIDSSYFGRWLDRLFGTDLDLSGKSTGYYDNGLIDPNEFSITNFPDNYLSREYVREDSLVYPITRTNPWFYQYCVNGNNSKCSEGDRESYMDCFYGYERYDWCYIAKGSGGNGSGGSPPPTTSLPDLTVSDVILKTPWGKETFVFGLPETMIAYANFKNIGNETPNITVEARFYLSKGYQKEPPSKWKRLGTFLIDRDRLNPGEDETGYETSKLSEDATVPGIYNIVACVDRISDDNNQDGAIQEGREDNNCSQEAVFEIPEHGNIVNIPDTNLIVKRITLNVQSPILPNGSLGAEMVIQNTGTQRPMSDFRSNYSIRGPGTNNEWKQIADDGSPKDEFDANEEQLEWMDERVPAPTSIGIYQLRGCADYQGNVQETNEADNCTETTFEIKEGKPDFIVSGLWLAEGTIIKSGTRVHPYCRIKNIGDGNSPKEMRLAYYIDQGTYRDSDAVSISDMCIGCETTEHVMNDAIKLGDRGIRSYRCCVDYRGVVAESNEENNCATMYFTVVK